MTNYLSHLNDLPTVEERYGDDQFRTSLQSIRSQLMSTVNDAAKEFVKPEVSVHKEGGCYHIVIQEGAPSQEPCDYCGRGKYTGLPGNACENCMNTGLKYPERGLNP